MTKSRSANWYETASGKHINPLKPDPTRIDICDIAHALSHICRFGGHSSCFYSVAQHSVLVSGFVSPENALLGLMHDAAEAYLGDVVRPLKRGLGKYSELETRWEDAIFSTFGINGNHTEVKEADNHVLSLEVKAFVRSRGKDWPDFRSPKMKHKIIIPWTPEFARKKFLERWCELSGEIIDTGPGAPSLSGIPLSNKESKVLLEMLDVHKHHAQRYRRIGRTNKQEPWVAERIAVLEKILEYRIKQDGEDV